MTEIQIPEHQVLWVQYHSEPGGDVTYVVTSDLYRELYYLYKVEKNGKLKKTKWQSHDPTELMEKIRK